MTGFLYKYRIPVLILFYVFQFIWMYTKSSLLALEEIGLLAWISLLFLVTFWMTLLIDMIRTKLYNKTFWLLSMLIFPWLAPAFYLFRRKNRKRRPASVFNLKRK